MTENKVGDYDPQKIIIAGFLASEVTRIFASHELLGLAIRELPEDRTQALHDSLIDWILQKFAN